MIPITEAQVTKFVSDWFQKLDDHAPLDEFYRMLASTGLQMYFPECTIWDFHTFANWYERVTELFFDEKHTLKTVPPKIEINGERAEISLEVAWKAVWVEPPHPGIMRVALTAKQKWILQRSTKNADGLEIVFYDAAVEPFQYEPESSRLPAKEPLGAEPPQSSLETGYRELCTSYHEIDTFRGKLLGFLPFATGAGILLLLNKDLTSLTGFFKPIGIFGIAITFGLFMYELYGIRKCDALIAAGKQLESRLRIQGQFASRPRSLLTFINEPFAAALIYPAVLAAWVYVALCYRTSLNFSGNARWFAFVTFLAGTVATIKYNFWLEEKGRERGRRSQMLQMLAETNESMLTAEEKGDRTALEKYLAPDFAIVRATDKTEDRATYLSAAPENKNRGRTASELEMRLQNDRAIFTCCVTTTHNPDGSPARGRFWNTRLFKWQNTRWLCTAWQVMRLPEN